MFKKVSSAVRLDNWRPGRLWSLWKSRRMYRLATVLAVDNVVHIVDKFVEEWVPEHLFGEQS